MDKTWYMAKGHPEIGWTVAVAWASLLQGIILGWSPIGFAVMATP